MTKEEVLAIFAQNGGFLKPDEVRARLYPRPSRPSFYTYLGRLRSQGLLERLPRPRRGQLAYRITQRGRDRLAFLRLRGEQDAALNWPETREKHC